MTAPGESLSADTGEIERHPCAGCKVEPGSPCRSRSNAVATAHHTGRFTKVPRLAKLLRVGQAGTEAGEYVVDLWSTAYVFLPGHRIRVRITASCFPRWDRVTQPSENRVHHDPVRPSRIVLPAIRA
jgi:hypothetical protein